MEELKKKAALGFAYKFAERVGAQGINFIVQIILARLLMPEEYGIIALVTVFITVCDVFVTYGFGNSLIVNKNSDSLDFSTCFYFGTILSIILYTSVFLTAPLMAQVYENYNSNLLVKLIRVMALRIPLASVNSVQHAYVSKHMWFRKFFIATSIGTLLSGAIAVIMAYCGLGVWSLVEQYLGNVFLDTICLAMIVGWKPTREFSFKRLKTIYDYGWKILLVGLIDTLYGQLRNLVIGNKYSSQDLAYYDRGYRFPSFGMRLVEPTVSSVLFPALSQSGDDKKQMKEITRKVIMLSTYIISPIMVGMAVVAKPLVMVLLTDKWLPCVIYLQIGCLANLFRPNQFINNCVVRASGNSGLLLKLDILKKSIGLVVLLISVHYGVFWIAFSLVPVYFVSMIINIAPNRKILNYGYMEQCKDFIRNLCPALIMGCCVYPLSLFDINPKILLVIQISLGILIYWLISIFTKNESYYTGLRFVKRILYRRKNV